MLKVRMTLSLILALLLVIGFPLMPVLIPGFPTVGIPAPIRLLTGRSRNTTVLLASSTLVVVVVSFHGNLVCDSVRDVLLVIVTLFFVNYYIFFLKNMGFWGFGVLGLMEVLAATAM